jgi:hypothetical protein
MWHATQALPRRGVAQTLLSVLVRLGTFEKIKCDASGVKLEG